MQSETQTYPDGSKQIRASTDDGRSVVRVEFDPSGSCVEMIAYGWDDQLRDTGWIVYDGAGNVIRRTELTYGHPAHETGVREFDGNSKQIRRVQYDIDETGHPIEERHFDAQNVQRSRGVYRHLENGGWEMKYYDNAGNKIPQPAA
jgi:hypothetical protein